MSTLLVSTINCQCVMKPIHAKWHFGLYELTKKTETVRKGFELAEIKEEINAVKLKIPLRIEINAVYISHFMHLCLPFKNCIIVSEILSGIHKSQSENCPSEVKRLELNASEIFGV